MGRKPVLELHLKRDPQNQKITDIWKHARHQRVSPWIFMFRARRTATTTTRTRRNGTQTSFGAPSKERSPKPEDHRYLEMRKASTSVSMNIHVSSSMSSALLDPCLAADVGIGGSVLAVHIPQLCSHMGLGGPSSRIHTGQELVLDEVLTKLLKCSGVTIPCRCFCWAQIALPPKAECKNRQRTTGHENVLLLHPLQQ
jgi:hypothetical protein